ncbi:MAG: hypothetical protein FJX29_13705 [Alphaproteobacteria bacterium]|nr:hypothetical protein [Alphaproteobacteria bacterium]
MKRFFAIAALLVPLAALNGAAALAQHSHGAPAGAAQKSKPHEAKPHEGMAHEGAEHHHHGTHFENAAKWAKTLMTPPATHGRCRTGS